MEQWSFRVMSRVGGGCVSCWDVGCVIWWCCQVPFWVTWVNCEASTGELECDIVPTCEWGGDSWTLFPAPYHTNTHTHTGSSSFPPTLPHFSSYTIHHKTHHTLHQRSLLYLQKGYWRGGGTSAGVVGSSKLFEEVEERDLVWGWKRKVSHI